MNPLQELKLKHLEHQTRRNFLKAGAFGLGSIALNALIGCQNSSSAQVAKGLGLPHFTPKAKRVIYLHMAGSPSQLELFDYKPALAKLDGLDCPPSLLAGKRFAFIQGVPKMLGPQFAFQQYGKSGAWISDRLPLLGEVADDLTFLKAVHTDQFNHAPAQLLVHTGTPRLGRPSMGAWVTYGLGSENSNLPSFVVLVSGGKTPDGGKSLWGSGFLPTVYQGVQCRTDDTPVLFLDNPEGMSRDLRYSSIGAINQLNQLKYEEVGDPEILTRIAQYEMAFKMQMEVPEVMDISTEPGHILSLYGAKPGESSFANNCLLARKLAENGVRFIQLYHWGWDSHGAGEEEALDGGFQRQCYDADRPLAALIKDLKQRGLLEDTLIVWGGEFGRTPMRENRDGKTMRWKGRDHHTEAFTMWMAGAGLQAGKSYGETDDLGYFGVKDRVHIYDVQATILHTLGLDHTKLTYYFQGRDFRLTDSFGEVIHSILT